MSNGERASWLAPRQTIADVARTAEIVIDRKGDRAAYGDVAESAVARYVVEQLGHDVIHLNTKPGERGVDLVTYDSATDDLFVWESKSSLEAAFR